MSRVGGEGKKQKKARRNILWTTLFCARVWWKLSKKKLNRTSITSPFSRGGGETFFSRLCRVPIPSRRLFVVFTIRFLRLLAEVPVERNKLWHWHKLTIEASHWNASKYFFYSNMRFDAGQKANKRKQNSSISQVICEAVSFVLRC